MIHIAEAYKYHNKILRVIKCPDNIYFERGDLETIAGENLYCETSYMDICLSGLSSVPRKAEVMSISTLPSLIFWTNNRDLFNIYEFFYNYFPHEYRLSTMKAYLLKLYIKIFGKKSKEVNHGTDKTH